MAARYLVHLPCNCCFDRFIPVANTCNSRTSRSIEHLPPILKFQVVPLGRDDPFRRVMQMAVEKRTFGTFIIAAGPCRLESDVAIVDYCHNGGHIWICPLQNALLFVLEKELRIGSADLLRPRPYRV